MNYLRKIYWSIAARLFPAYVRRSIHADFGKFASILMRRSPVQKALMEKYPTYGEQIRGSMAIPKNLNDTPHWD